MNKLLSATAACSLIAIILITLFSACSNNTTLSDKYICCGVSKELAAFRKDNIGDMEYTLHFSVPKEKEHTVTGSAKIEFSLRKSIPVVLDFKADAKQIESVCVNGTASEYVFMNEHIIIPKNECFEGKNSIEVNFVASGQSLNRRDEFLYTLLVPDRARTLFPCMDQPDLKAIYSLSLEVPQTWQAIANGAVAEVLPANSDIERTDIPNRKVIRFNKTEPLSTYLFSFVAGMFQKKEFSEDGRNINIYYRETDSKKIAQCQVIADEVFDSLKWLEEYTGIAYPFAKYDLIILPGFQFGGMEHTGATLYNDSRMFLSEHPTINDRLNRSSLIAHETAHMWFGDLVTMAWFDDVWTKEVFANYFASRIVEPLFKDVNHRLNFILDYLPSSYSEDRTDGANPIKQDLDNLGNAGLVYGNIIYNKSPVVMEMLVQKLGEENFRLGIQEYLKTYSYGNATWEDLVGILDRYTAEDLESWSNFWINTPGMPETTVEEGEIPNADGRSYGYFKLTGNGDEILWNTLFEALAPTNESNSRLLKMSSEELEVLRGSLLITLYENLRRGNLDPELFMQKMLKYIQLERNPLLFSLALGYAGDCHNLYSQSFSTPSELENTLWSIVTGEYENSFRLQALKLYFKTAASKEGLEHLFDIWKKQSTPAGISLSENDFMNLSYILALNMPQQAEKIVSEQLSRISDPDRRSQYQFISPSVSPEKATRDSVFNSLLEPSNRRIEPWASASLGYLNHHTRQEEALEYIMPALEEMKQIQQTGDIFFPRSWAKALLSGHNSKEAAEIVAEFFARHPDYPVMLGRKIKQQAWHLTSAHLQD